ncbi:MAG: TIGR03619 family F420-dependent LLM class oxidoreductase [Actinomycetales bacterium]|nr:TIGR03619 family F420-dependent LLM class oxidoreductase [Actinomycetales bacterium]
MKLGVVYPQNETHGDPRGLREIGLAAEELGFDSLLFYDHVVGAEHADREPPLWGPYTEDDSFHDPFVAFGYLAGITSRIELATGILILPQRQTVLAAQQAADADLLSGGRLRIGVGTGWNWVEYDALGVEFAHRGARLDEQIALMRRLWDEPLVTFEGRFHTLERCCINPRPNRQIPIWVGGFSEAAFRRGSRLGDGFTFAGNPDDAIAGLGRVRELLSEAGRDEDGFGRELILTRARTPEDVVAMTARWRAAGGTGVSVLTQKAGLDSIAAHVDYLGRVKSALDAG